MECHAGPVGGEMRPPGAHPSHGTVSRVSLNTRVCLGVVAIKADATATASTTPAWDEWPFVQSLMHPFSICFLSSCCVPGMVLGAGAKW